MCFVKTVSVSKEDHVLCKITLSADSYIWAGVWKLLSCEGGGGGGGT